MLQTLGEFGKSDQYWYVTIDSHFYTAWSQYKGQLGRLPWELDTSKGRTAGCWVSKNGEFHLCYSSGLVIDDVMRKGIPTDKPLWGFVALYGAWQVEANYKVAMPKGEAVVHSKSPSYVAWFLL